MELCGRELVFRERPREAAKGSVFTLPVREQSNEDPEDCADFFRYGWTCLFVSPVLALPVITNVVETGGDNEATDTIPAKWTGTTFPVSVANEPVPGLVIGQNYTVGLFGNGAPAFVDRNHRYSNHSVDPAAVPPGFTDPVLPHRWRVHHDR